MQSALDKRQLILQAAEALFRRFGYTKTSLDDIAREAGLSKGTIYYYFVSKEDVFVAVVKEAGAAYYKQLKEVIASEKSFEEKFTAVISQPIKLIYEHAPILGEAMRSLPSSYLTKMDEFRQENRQYMIAIMSEVIEEGIKKGIVDASVEVDKLSNVLFDWFLLGDSNIIIKFPEEFVKKAELDYEIIVELLLHGIIKRGHKS